MQNKFNLTAAFVLFFTVQTGFTQSDKVKVIHSDDQVEGLEKLDVNNPILDDALSENALPPEMLEEFWKYYVKSKKAAEHFDEPESIKSITIPISTGPNQKSEIVEVAINYGVTLTFKDPNGESVFIERYKLGNEDLFHIDDGNDDGNSSENEKSISSYLTITNENKVGATNLHVWLMSPDGKPGENRALSFYLKIVRAPNEYTDRINYVVVNPSQQYEKNKVELNPLDALTLALNNRKPTPDAERVTFSEGVTGWKSGGQMWIRTSLRLVFPSYSPDAALSSDNNDGINVYKVAAHPFIHVVDNRGRFIKLQLLENTL